MGDYTEHLISLAGGDGEPDALDLDAIQARLSADEAEYGTGYEWEHSFQDRRALLALVLEQQARRACLLTVADDLEESARVCSEWQLRDDADRAAASIRAALTTTDER